MPFRSTLHRLPGPLGRRITLCHAALRDQCAASPPRWTDDTTESEIALPARRSRGRSSGRLEQIRVGWNRRRRSTDPVNLLYPFEVDRIHLVRSEEHTSEPQSLMRIAYAVHCLKTKNQHSTEQDKFINPQHV